MRRNNKKAVRLFYTTAELVHAFPITNTALPLRGARERDPWVETNDEGLVIPSSWRHAERANFASRRLVRRLMRAEFAPRDPRARRGSNTEQALWNARDVQAVLERLDKLAASLFVDRYQAMLLVLTMERKGRAA